MSEQFQIRVTVPMRLSWVERDRLFTAVADAVESWEPAERDGWDALVESGPVPLSTAGAFAVDCPECIAMSGEPCRDLRSRHRERTTVHRQRVWAAKGAPPEAAS